MQPAVQIRVTDPSMRFYLQQFPFLTGPDEAMNQAALETIRQCVHVRSTVSEATVRRESHSRLSLSATERANAAELLGASGQSAQQIAAAEHDYAWRVQALPTTCASVLCIGCGEGHELAFIRARLPKARIVVIDYVAKALPGLLEAVGAEFVQGDLVEGLRHNADRYDAMFSNHTLEHMYDPEEVLSLVFGVLRPGGVVVSGLPMDADTDAVLHQEIVALALQAPKLHAIDMGLFDAGHPWKTHPGELAEVLRICGFDEHRIVQRSDVPARTPLNRHSSARPDRMLGGMAYRASFGLARTVIKHFLPDGGPLILRRLLVAAERRVPFGANRLQSQHSPDVLMVATKSATSA